MPHAVASLSHRLHGRVQSPSHTIASYHGIQGSAKKPIYFFSLNFRGLPTLPMVSGLFSVEI